MGLEYKVGHVKEIPPPFDTSDTFGIRYEFEITNNGDSGRYNGNIGSSCKDEAERLRKVIIDGINKL